MNRNLLSRLFAVVLVAGGMCIAPVSSWSQDAEAEQKEATLKQQAEEAKARQAAAKEALNAAQANAKTLGDTLAKLKADLAKAEADLKQAEEKYKTEQDAATKAAEAKAAADKVAADAAAAAEAAKKAADEAAAAAVAAAKAAEDAQAAAAVTEKAIAANKEVIAKTPEQVTAAEAALNTFKPQLEGAETALAAVSTEAVAKQKELESLLIGSGKLVSFAESVAPIIAKRCLACHNARTAKGRFNMESFAAILKGGESGESFVAGDGGTSLLYILVEDGSMPKDADPLTDEEKATIKKWIDTGATLDAGFEATAPLIAIMPKLPQPAAPEAYRVPIPVTAATFSPDGSMLASSGYHEVILYNPKDGAVIRRITNVAERTYDLDFSPDGTTIAVASGTPGQIGEIKLFNVADGTMKADLVRTDDAVFAIKFSPDGTRLAAGGADRAIRVYEVATGKQQLQIEDHADWVMGLAWSPDGTKIASASRDKTSKIFDTATGDSLVTFNGHGEPVFGVAFSADGQQVLTSGRDKQIRSWNPANAQQIRAIGGFGNEVFRIQATADGKLFSASADLNARLHNVADGAAVRSYAGHTDWVYCIAYNPATKMLAAGSFSGQIKVWNEEDGAEIATFYAAPGYTPPAK
ncbi:MAG: c-type cytochrome domain-containing protein [Planctomycetaceae bacterium]